MNHIKKTEIVFPEISDRKIHVQRKITVEAGKESRTTTEWQDFCELVTISCIVIGFLILLAILTS